MTELYPTAVTAFARQGIALGAVTERDFAWAHDPYHISEPDRKDIEVRICVGNYMGKVVHRETVKNVHYEDAAKVAESILNAYRNGLDLTDAQTSSAPDVERQAVMRP